MRPREVFPRSLFVFSYIQLQFCTWGNADFAQYSCANPESPVINGFFRAWNEPVMNPSRTRFRRAGWVKDGFALAISYSPANLRGERPCLQFTIRVCSQFVNLSGTSRDIRLLIWSRRRKKFGLFFGFSILAAQILVEDLTIPTGLWGSCHQGVQTKM